MDMGKFINKMGYTLTKRKSERHALLFHKAIYEFYLRKSKPLTFELPDGTKIRPDKHLAETDMGSTPMSLQLLFPKDEFLLSYIFHDSGYNHHGLYFKGPKAHVYGFKPMTREDVDKLCLLRMIEVEGGGVIKRNMIYRIVRMCGGSPWKKGKEPDVVV